MYTLILWFGISTTTSFVVPNFESEQACRYAGAQIEAERLLQTNHWKAAADRALVTYVCIPLKGREDDK